MLSIPLATRGLDLLLDLAIVHADGGSHRVVNQGVENVRDRAVRLHLG